MLPDDAPNHFLINIAPDAVDDVEEFWATRGAPLETLYPMVRGRLTELNGEPVKEAVSKDERVGALNRELNLTWMPELPEDNRIVDGQWFGPGETEGVSVEAELAEEISGPLGLSFEQFLQLHQRIIEAGQHWSVDHALRCRRCGRSIRICGYL